MKPIRLELEGFTSFREKAVIDFSKLDLFAITGPTGAGKTSLIDALVYSLYGMTPRAGANVSELISQGAKRSMVLLEFQAGEKRYRISRTMRRGKTSVQSNRRLEELREDGEWESLTGLERETRGKIQEIIGLDFNGFTKSVVLPQGEFDRFLKGDPADRRKILTDLLQLRIYEEMGRRARDRAKDAAARASTLKGQLETNFSDATAKHRDSLKVELAEAKRAKKELDREAEAVESGLPIAREIRAARRRGEQAKSDLEGVEGRLETARRSARESTERLQRERESLIALGEKIEAVGYDPRRHLALSALRPKADRLAKLELELRDHEKGRLEIERRLTRLQESIDLAEEERDQARRAQSDAESRLRGAESALESAIQRHGPAEETRRLISELPLRRDKIDRLAELSQRLEAHQTEVEETRGRVEALAAEAEAAERALDQAKKELAQLRRDHSAADLRAHLQPGRECPVCRQTVHHPPAQETHPALASAEKRVRLGEAEAGSVKQRLADQTARLDASPEQRRLIEEGLKDAERQAKDLDGRIERALGEPAGADPGGPLKALLRKIEEMDLETRSARKGLENAAAAERGLNERVAEARHAFGLAERDAEALRQIIRKEREECRQLSLELADWPNPEELAREIKKLEASQREKSRLEKLRDQSRDQLAATEERFRETEKTSHLLRAERERLAGIIAGSQSELRSQEAALAEIFPDWPADDKRDEADRLSSRRSDVERRRSQAAEQIARGEEKLSQLAKRIEQARQMREEAKTLESQAAVAHELGLALRAGRLITFIQEEALSRLGDGATGHLRSLSSERYSFAVQQGNFLVLDHWNADEARPVTTLSGGESFLASLSLALSLAESLAEFSTERGSFSLESLFLDEGFSTLDPETLEIVLQGIEALAAGDRMIGAVSHIQELAERFPNRIQVRKSVGGSTVVVD